MRTNAQIRWGLLGLGWLVAAALLGARPQPAQAQTEDPLLYACYVPDVGAVYRVGTDSTPDDCFETTHVKFSWNPMDLGCTTGEVAKWTGTGWACGTDDVGAPLNHTHHGSDLVNGSVTNAELAADVSARVRGWHREQVEDKEVSPRSFAEAFAQCPAGQRVLGGGVKTKYDFFGSYTSSTPIPATSLICGAGMRGYTTQTMPRYTCPYTQSVPRQRNHRQQDKHLRSPCSARPCVGRCCTSGRQFWQDGYAPHSDEHSSAPQVYAAPEQLHCRVPGEGRSQSQDARPARRVPSRARSAE
jgi:hypothetical protein